MERKLLQAALEAASNAGDVLRDRLWEERQIRLKGYRDTVTDADTAAEEAVFSVVRSRFPQHSIVSEEAGEIEQGTEYVWLIDPLDGTTNYSRGHPTFSVSIAIMSEGKPVVGVVHDPLRSHTFSAIRDGGATLNGRPLRVSDVDSIGDALLGLEWAHADSDRETVLRRLDELAPNCRTVRSLGSAALAMAWVGAGWLDLYFATGLYPWDVAAASLIVTEGGGLVTGWGGEAWSVGQSDLLVSNGLIHTHALEMWAGVVDDSNS
jgi:myo-inositol-1(or 4)-monophosphatase